MKLTTVRYLGFTAMDRRFSDAMLPWVVTEIRKRESKEQISLGAEDGTLQGYNMDFELQFSHKIQDISRFSQADTDPCTFLYLMIDQGDKLLYCYMFQAGQQNDVSDLYQQMKDQGASNNGPNLTSLCGDISPSSSHFFEVLYVGKIRVSHRKLPDTFIDDALDKFKSHELARRASYDSSASTDSCSTNENVPHSEETMASSGSENEKTEAKSDAGVSEPLQKLRIPGAVLLQGPTDYSVVKKEHNHDHNRTMVLQVGRMDLRLISPDRKQVLLHRQHKDVVSCLQGQRSPEYFGFVCKEAHSNQNNNQGASTHHSALFVGFVFKCESSSVAIDAVGAVSQAAAAPSGGRPRAGSVSTPSAGTPPPSLWSPVIGATVSTCEHCPMVWYHRLCTDIEGLGDRKTQAMIFRRIENLDEEEQQSILTKFRGAETDSIRDQNEFLMMLLRAHCEMKQNRHVHDTMENRSEFLSHYLGGTGGSNSHGGSGTIFMKAKRSLSSSFEHLLKRKGSRDDIGAHIPRDLSLPITGPNLGGRETSPTSLTPYGCESGSNLSNEGSQNRRTRAATIGSYSDITNSSLSPEKAGLLAVSPKSPMMDIFMKVGNSPRTPCADPEGPAGRGASPRNAGSWRQAIFNRVVTPNKNGALAGHQKRLIARGTLDKHNENEDKREKRTSEELRLLWKRAIKQAVLLVRMEKENERLRARQEVSAMKRVKLEYDEMCLQTNSALPLWDMVLGGGVADRRVILTAAGKGIPASRRGDVWQRLTKMYCTDKPPYDATCFPNYNSPYEQLLKQLTAQQHAILIDLGRTFPNHPYYKAALGPGQLALFNLLKAYSLLDPEVGYCQGLSFVAGILLLHMEEADAFHALKHLMFRRNMRVLYLPDMVALQIKLYQLSRLLHDRQQDLYNHLDVFEVAPTLYAAPWILTLFASQFPLGFVARVFDILFVEGPEVVFRIALSLLNLHQDALLNCDSFEMIMDYLKNKLTELDAQMIDKIMTGALAPSNEVAGRLNEYKVEYQVLQEEASSSKPHIEELERLRSENRAILERNSSILAQLEMALSNVQRLERNRTLQQSSINKLEVMARTLEVSVVTLGTFIDNLVERKIEVEIPGEVRRIVGQLMVNERRKNDQRPPGSHQLMRTISNSANLFKRTSEEDEEASEKNSQNEKTKATSPQPTPRAMVKSLSTGRIGVSLSANFGLNPIGDISSHRSISLNSASDLERELRLGRSLGMMPGVPLRVIDDDNSRDSNWKDKNVPNLGSKVSHFFSNTHSHILRQHWPLHGATSPPLATSPHHSQIIREESREDMSPTDENVSFEPNNNKSSIRESITLPLNSKNAPTSGISPSESIDSGVASPPTSENTLTFENCVSGDTPCLEKPEVHPLSGSDVSFTYNGTTKLKTIRSIRNLSRNSSPDLLGK